MLCKAVSKSGRFVGFVTAERKTDLTDAEERVRSRGFIPFGNIFRGTGRQINHIQIGHIIDDLDAVSD